MSGEMKLCYVLIIIFYSVLVDCWTNTSNVCCDCPEEAECFSCSDRRNLRILQKHPKLEPPCGNCLQPIYLTEGTVGAEIVCEECQTSNINSHAFQWFLPHGISPDTYSISQEHGNRSMLRFHSVDITHKGPYTCTYNGDHWAIRDIITCKKILKPANFSCTTTSFAHSAMKFSCSWLHSNGFHFDQNKCTYSTDSITISDGFRQLDLRLNDPKCANQRAICSTELKSIDGFGTDENRSITVAIHSSSNSQTSQVFEFTFSNRSSTYKPEIPEVSLNIGARMVGITWHVHSSHIHQECPSQWPVVKAQVDIQNNSTNMKVSRSYEVALNRNNQHDCVAYIQIDDLIPDAEYGIQLGYGLKYSAHMSDSKEFLFRTKQTSPKAVIAVIPGSIILFGDTCRAYWKRLPEWQHFGDGFEITSDDAKIHVENGASFASFNCSEEKLTLECKNHIGPCPNASVFDIKSSLSQKSPTVVATERNPKTKEVNVFWESKFEAKSTTLQHFTVMWCLALAWKDCHTLAGYHFFSTNATYQDKVHPLYSYKFILEDINEPVVVAVSRCSSKSSCSVATQSMATFSELKAPGKVNDLSISLAHDKISANIHWNPPHKNTWNGLPVEYWLYYSKYYTANYTLFYNHRMNFSLLHGTEIVSVVVNCSMFSSSVWINVKAVSWPTGSAGPMSDVPKQLKCASQLIFHDKRSPNLAISGFWIAVIAIITSSIALLLVGLTMKALIDQRYLLKKKLARNQKRTGSTLNGPHPNRAQMSAHSSRIDEIHFASTLGEEQCVQIEHKSFPQLSASQEYYDEILEELHCSEEVLEQERPLLPPISTCPAYPPRALDPTHSETSQQTTDSISISVYHEPKFRKNTLPLMSSTYASSLLSNETGIVFVTDKLLKQYSFLQEETPFPSTLTNIIQVNHFVASAKSLQSMQGKKLLWEPAYTPSRSSPGQKKKNTISSGRYLVENDVTNQSADSKDDYVIPQFRN